MLFPQLGPQYLDTKGKAVLSRMEAFYAESITINQSFWAEADTDTRFMVGDQSLWSDLYGSLPSNRRRQFNFNRILRVINMIDGYQRRNRKSTVALPYENGDNLTADQYSKVLMWCNQQDSVLETISTAFRGSLITGMNLLQVWVDYRSDPVSGNIKVDCKSYNEFLIDPYFKKQDLSDCNAIWTRKFLTKREVISLMPDNADEILGLIGNSNGTGRDGKFQFEPESYNYGMKNLLTYDEFYYRDYRTQKMLVDTQTGETMEWKHHDEEALRLFLQSEPMVTVVEQDIPTVKLAIVVEGKVMYDGPNPMGDKYPFVPVFAYYYPECPYFPWRIQGVVRGLRDSQYLYNRRKIIELDILESQITSGFIYKENSLVNPKDIFLQGQGRGLALKEEAAMTDVQQIQAPQVPPSMIELSKMLGEEISQISGVNEELLGSATDDKAGILSMLRQGAGLTTLQILFDNLDHAQKILGNLMLDAIQSNFMPGKIKKILEGEEPAPQFYNKAFGKYNVVIEEGLNTPTQKQMNFAQLMELRTAGLPIPDDVLLDASTIQNKNKLIEAVQANAQAQQQMQQQQAELQMQQLASQIRLSDATAQANQGLATERVSRVQENQALAQERLAKAEHDQDTALLDKVKALKELESLDISHIKELIAMANLVENKTNIPLNPQEGPVGRGETLAAR
jgi:hypothetical protein